MIRFLFLAAFAVVIPTLAVAEEGSPAASSSAVSPNPSAFSIARPTYRDVAPDRAFTRGWKASLVPLIASQGLDAASSYGMRELNPALANGNGQFGMKSAGIKFAAIGALVGIEYLVIRRHPRAANAFSKLNWATGIVTTGFAAHNFAIR